MLNTKLSQAWSQTYKTAEDLVGHRYDFIRFSNVKYELIRVLESVNQPVTAEYNPTRLNVVVDRNNIITDAWMG